MATTHLSKACLSSLFINMWCNHIDLSSKHHWAFRATNVGSATHRRLESASSHPMLTELVQAFKNSKKKNDPWPNQTVFEGFWVSVFPYLLRKGNYITMPWLSWFPNCFPGTQDSEQLDLLCMMLLNTISWFENNTIYYSLLLTISHF